MRRRASEPQEPIVTPWETDAGIASSSSPAAAPEPSEAVQARRREGAAPIQRDVYEIAAKPAKKWPTVTPWEQDAGASSSGASSSSPQPYISPAEKAKTKAAPAPAVSRPLHRTTPLPLDQSVASARKYVDELQAKVLANDPNAWRYPSLPTDLYRSHLALDSHEKHLEKVLAAQMAKKEGNAPIQHDIYPTPPPQPAPHLPQGYNQGRANPDEAAQYAQDFAEYQQYNQERKLIGSLNEHVKKVRESQPEAYTFPFHEESTPMPEIPPRPFAKEQGQHIPALMNQAQPMQHQQRTPLLNPYVLQQLRGRNEPQRTQYVPFQPKMKSMDKVMQYFDDKMFHPENYPETEQI